MTQKDLNKEFSIPYSHFTISRSDYLDMPSPMAAHLFSDEQMENLAYEIGRYIPKSDDETHVEEFWKIMEQQAVAMGMMYYEDMFDLWLEKFQDLDVSDQIHIYNEVVGPENAIWRTDDFDDIVEDLGYSYTNVLWIGVKNAKQIHVGDEYWRYTRRSGFETLEEDNVLDLIELAYDDIFEKEDLWADFINPKELKA